MVGRNRDLSQGNQRVDYTKVKQTLKEVNPVLAATLRNAVAEPRTMNSDQGQEKKFIDTHKLQRLSDIISNNITAANDLREITAYIDKGELIWNALLFRPNGFQDRIITRDTKPSRYKSTALHAAMLPIWDDYFTNDYKIESQLNKYASDILWNTGSYCLFNLSRPNLDYLINGSEAEVKLPGSRTGNEAYLTKAREVVAEEFAMEGGRRVMKNKGGFVRNPFAKDKVDSVSGLETLLGNVKDIRENEFHIFDQSKEDHSLLNITLTDNPAILYLQRFNQASREKEVMRVSGLETLDLMISSSLARENRAQKDAKKDKEPGKPDATTRNMSTTEAEAIKREMYPHRNPVRQSLQFVKSNDQFGIAPYGQGLTYHIPSEAVMTVHLNGNLHSRKDFIFLLDDEGSFLKSTGDYEFYQSSNTGKANVENKPKAGDANNLISSLKTVASGKDCDFDMSEFIDVAKNSLLRAFTESVLSNKGDNITITMDEETNKIWLARMFRQQGVRALYVPGESVTYMAFKYNKLGVGQSLTQAAKLHIARLAAYDVADALANIAGATPHTQMDVDIPKEAPDPEHVIAIARQAFYDVNPRLHNLMSSAQLSVPLIVDAIRESSLTVKINASDNPHMPAPGFTLSHLDKAVFQPVDSTSRDNVQNSIANYFHLPRSWMDITDDANNFKIEAVTEHDMVLNQRTIWATMMEEFLVDFERKHTRVNAPLLEALIQCIKDNPKLWKPDTNEDLPKSDEETIKVLLVDFMNNIEVKLPVPSSTEKTNTVKDSIDAVRSLVDMWQEVSGYEGVMEQMTKVLGIDESQFSAEEVKKSIRSVFLTEAFRRFNLPMPFDEIADKGKGGGIASLVHQVVHQRNNVGEFLTTFLTEVAKSDTSLVKKNKDKLADLIQKLNEASGTAEEDQVPDDGTGEGGEGDGDDGSLDDTGSTGDLNDTGEDTPTPDDTGTGEEEPADDQPPAEGEEESEEEEPTPDDDASATGAKPKPGDPGFNPF